MLSPRDLKHYENSKKYVENPLVNGLSCYVNIESHIPLKDKGKNPPSLPGMQRAAPASSCRRRFPPGMIVVPAHTKVGMAAAGINMGEPYPVLRRLSSIIMPEGFTWAGTVA
jgi:hypothetical protein